MEARAMEVETRPEDVIKLRDVAEAKIQKVEAGFQKSSGMRTSEFMDSYQTTALNCAAFRRRFKTDTAARDFVKKWAWAVFVIHFRIHTEDCVIMGPVRFAYYLRNEGVLAEVTDLVMILENLFEIIVTVRMKQTILYVRLGEPAKKKVRHLE
jgi:hypothetical protein